jgi:hypothetical protein
MLSPSSTFTLSLLRLFWLGPNMATATYPTESVVAICGSSGVETKNWRVQRLRRTRGIEIFTEERDLAAGRPQE